MLININKMRKLFSVPIAVCAAALAAAIGITSLIGKPSPAPKQPAPAAEAATQAAKPALNNTVKNEGEMRGVWITYIELDMQNESDKSEKAFTEKFTDMAQRCSDNGFNTLIVQIRPFCDALYESKLFPASHILSGAQGQSPGYDALKIMCSVCKKLKLKIHAWVNPYRVSLNSTPQKLADSNPYSADSSVGIETESGVILNPANDKARKLICDGVAEIVRNYDVDGVQFDDYFYPEDIGDKDAADYTRYKSNAKSEDVMSLEQWRAYNVNLLIAQVYNTVHKEKQDVVFGISPQGNLQNNYKLCADVKSWCQSVGYIDYICPQIYFSPRNPRLGFEDALNEWAALEKHGGLKVYAGLAGYKAGSDSDSGTWLGSDEILKQEYILCKSNEGISGIMLYSCSSLTDEKSKSSVEQMCKVFN